MKKNKTVEIATHLICWLIFLSIPFLFSPEPPPEMKHAIGKLYLIPVLTGSIFLILLFYFNYFVLIPKFLFTNRYISYTLLCIACISLKFIGPIIMMTFFPKPEPIIMLPDPHLKSMMPMAFTNNLLIYVVVVLASIGLRLNSRWKLTEQERLQSELSALKSQINPHFLFNTLNSVYAETLGKANKAAEMILKLSDMMRYTLTEGHFDKVSIQREFDYIVNYIELQKLRLASKAKLEYRIINSANDLQIAPFLLIPFIENAFKYGVNSEQNSYVRIELKTINSELNLIVFNKKVETEKTHQETFGLGIKNTKQRLALIYPDKHLLTIYETAADYLVSLHINLA